MQSSLFAACCALRLPTPALSFATRRLAVAAPRAGIATMGAAALGDVVTVNYSLRPDLTSRAAAYGENADKLTESLPFDIGKVAFVLGGGGYLDGLHEAVLGMEEGSSVDAVSIDSGAGEYIAENVATVPKDKAPPGLKAGMAVMLNVGMGRQVQATVSEMTDDSVTLDANHPLAGCKMLLDATLERLEPASTYEVMTLAGGCFWGVELAYQREVGVVGTAVGYTQGESSEPSYEQVCAGTTGHTEAVQVVFDPRVVSYQRLCELLMNRLGDNAYLLNQVGNDRGTQYRHGIYSHSDGQAATARAVLDALGEHKTLGPVQTEIAEATTFHRAEDYHQQYLQKGGQSAKKDAEETIRCYG